MKINIYAGHRYGQYCLLLAFFLSAIGSLQAQNRQVTGIVSHQGQALSEVDVRIASSSLYTTTDEKGYYEIGIKSGDVLVFSSLGYETKEITVAAESEINIELELAFNQLDAIELSSGYYSLKERSKTGNVTKIGQEQFEEQVVQSPIEALQGRVAGLEVVSVTGMKNQAPAVSIRGQNSLRYGVSSQPLYVVDGIPINNEGIFTNNSLFDLMTGLNPLSTLDESLIESIEVLKDADATAIYGSRGANGVILINTKKAKSGKVKLEINTETGISWMGNFVQLMNTEQYLAMRREAFENDAIEPTASNAPDLLLWDQHKYTDWQKELLGNKAQFQKYHFGLSGGNEQTTFLLSGGLKNETTIFPGDYGAQANNLYANMNHRSKDNKLQVTSSVSYAYDKNNLFDAGLFVINSVRLSPNAPDLFDKNGEMNWELDEFGNPTFNNPLVGMLNPNIMRMQSFQWNGALSYEIIKNLQFKTNAGINNLAVRNQQINLKKNYNPLNHATNRSSTSKRNTVRNHILIEPQLNYVYLQNRHKIEGLAGVTFQKNEERVLHINGTGYVAESQVGNLELADDISIYSDALTEYRYTALFGRLGYSYSNRYNLNFTGRRDGSSRFGRKNRFGNFGAVGAAWNFHNEEFIINSLSWLTYGKLRTSFGITGNDDIGDYQYLDLYEQVYTYPGSLSAGGIIPMKLNNPYYQWEKNKKMEIAMDLGLWNDKVFVSGSWYKERSGNQLINLELPGITGFTNVEGNLSAEVQNKGWEFLIESSLIQQNNFSWKTSANLTFPENKLLSFPNLESSGYSSDYEIGKPLSIVKLYKYKGVDPLTGLYSFEDVNNDGVLNADDKIITKDLSRKFYGGWSNNLQYKNMSLSFLFEFVKQQGWGYLTDYGIPGGQAGSRINVPLEYLDRWQNPNDEAKHQKFMQGFDLNSFNYRQSDQNITNTSFVRLKSISFKYNLPKNTKEIFGLENAQIYLNAQNLLTWTPYKGYDPQNSGSFAIPALRSVHVGLKITI